MSNKYQCMECNNTESFIAEYRLLGQCLVDGDGTELELNHISPIDNEHIENELSTEIDVPCKCANCGSILIANVNINKEEIKELINKLKLEKEHFEDFNNGNPYYTEKMIKNALLVAEMKGKEIQFYKKLLKEVKACQD